MTRDQKIAKAKELRAAGLTYREIGERLGVHLQTARRWLIPKEAELDRESSRAFKALNPEAMRVYNQRYDKTHRGKCSECGGAVMARKHDGGICSACRSDKRDRRARRIEQWWAEGLTLKQIASELGWTVGQVGVEIDSLRRKGCNLPYRRVNAAPRFPDQVAS